MKTHILKCKSAATLLKVINRVIHKGGKFSVNKLTIRYSYPTRVLTNRLPKGTVNRVREGKVSYKNCGRSGKYEGLYRLRVGKTTYIITAITLLNLTKKAGRQIPTYDPKK